MAKQKHTVRQLPKGTNFIDYCRRAFPLLGSKTAVKKAVADQRLLRNGRPARLTDRLEKGDRLELKGAGLPKARKFDKELPIIFQDDHLLVINKPAGIAVNGNRVQTVENALAGLPPSPEADALPRPVAAHRIDLPTKGLVLLAKTKSALMALSQAFEENEVDKAYQAVVHGQPPPQFTVDTLIDGKDAITKVETLRTVPSHVFGHLSLVELKPITGRTHQLRIHLQQRGVFNRRRQGLRQRAKDYFWKGALFVRLRPVFFPPRYGQARQCAYRPAPALRQDAG